MKIESQVDSPETNSSQRVEAMPQKDKRHHLIMLGILGMVLLCLLTCTGLFLSKLTLNFTFSTYPPFIKAAQQGNIVEADHLLRTGELVNQKTIGDQTALHIASEEGQDDMVRWLLARDADPRAQDQHAQTPADYARSQGHIQTAKIILDYIELLNKEQEAVVSRNKDALRNLLSQDGRGYTILHLMAQAGATLAVAEEITAGADVNAQTLKGLTPLHKAVISGKTEICRMLLDAGADVNARDVYNATPLYYAILYNNKDLVKLFLDEGADPNIRSIFANETALDYAKRQGNAEIIALLEQK